MRAMNWNFSNRPGWVFLLVGIVLILLASQGGAVNQMRSGQCMIKAKQLLHGFTTVVDYHPDSDGNTTYTTTYKTDAYAPYFEYVVRTADGRTYAANGYDGSDSYTSDLAAQQAIVDRYNVGQSYQCWYDPANPTQAVLVLQPDWGINLLGGVFLLLGALFAVIGIDQLGLFKRRERFWCGEDRNQPLRDRSA